MKYPGQPESAPSWYRERTPSYIEREFDKALDSFTHLLEREQWFGDRQKHSRYRVDYILKDARLIIELDGHDHHSTKEQLEKDAIRQRYLSRAGYTVIRFTGREIYRDAAACVLEVRQIYKERMHRAPVTHRALYIDHQFFLSESLETRRIYKILYPEKNLSLPLLDKFIPNAIGWLHEKSFIAAFVFHLSEETAALSALDGTLSEYEKGEVRINTIASEQYAVELGVHMMCFSHLFDEFYLVGDDPAYIEPLRSVLPEKFSERKVGPATLKYLPNGKLLRKGNDETSFAGTDLAYVRWQNICYPMGMTMGLSYHEL